MIEPERINRDWIREFEPEANGLVREIVIREYGSDWFSIYETYPQNRLLTALCLDEVLGFLALAVVNGRPGRWKWPAEQRAWNARYGGRQLQPWEKQLVENCPR